MMTCFSPLSFLPMKKMGETNCDGPSLICPSAFSCLSHISSTSPSALDRGYGLHLIEVGASGRNLIDMFGLRFGGNHFESSSENTLQWCLNSFGIVSIVICVCFISSRQFHSWARFVHLRKATSLSGSCPAHFRASWARLKTLLRYRNFVLCRATVPPLSSPSVQSIWGLNSCQKGYPRIILSFPKDVRKNF